MLLNGSIVAGCKPFGQLGVVLRCSADISPAQPIKCLAGLAAPQRLPCDSPWRFPVASFLENPLDAVPAFYNAIPASSKNNLPVFVGCFAVYKTRHIALGAVDLFENAIHFQASIDRKVSRLYLKAVSILEFRPLPGVSLGGGFL